MLGGSGSARDRRWALAVAIALLAPVLTILGPLLLSATGSSNQGDTAATELAVQNAVRFHELLGPYDRFGWNHPGPALFYLLAGPYALLGQQAIGVKVGVLILNTSSLAGIIALLWRRRGPLAAVGAAAVTLALVATVGSGYLINAWTPVIVTFPCALFVRLLANGMLVGTHPNLTLNLPGPMGDYSAALLAVLAATTVVAVACRRVGERFGAALAGSALVLGGVYCLSLTAADGALQGYFVVWASLTLCAGLAAVLLVARVVQPRFASAGLSAVLACGLVVASVAVTHEAAVAAVHRTWIGIADATNTLAEALPAGDNHLLMCISLDAGPDAEGLVANLRRQGWDVRVEERWLLVFGTALSPTGRENVAVFVDRAGPLEPLPVRTKTVLGGSLVFRLFVPHGRNPAITSRLCPLVPDSHPAPRYSDYLARR